MAPVNHLSHIQQVDLEEEAQGAACDLVGSPSDGVAEFAPHRQAISLGPWLEDKQRGWGGGGQEAEKICNGVSLCIRL